MNERISKIVVERLSAIAVVLALIVAATITISCAQGVQYKADTLPTGTEVSILSSEGDIVTGSFSASSTTSQQLSAGGVISGTSLILPPGALGGDSSITIELGTSLIDGLSSELAISGEVLSGSSPVVVSSSAARNPLLPMNLVIPINLSLALALANASAENMAVFYKIIDYTDNTYRSGVVPRSEIKLINGKVTFTSSYFGSFQVVYTEAQIKETVEVVSTTPIVTAQQEKINNSAIPTFTMTGRTSETNGTTLKNFSSLILKFSTPVNQGTFNSALEVTRANSGVEVEGVTKSWNSVGDIVTLAPPPQGWGLNSAIAVNVVATVVATANSQSTLNANYSQTFNTTDGTLATASNWATSDVAHTPILATNSSGQSLLVYLDSTYVVKAKFHGSNTVLNSVTSNTNLADTAGSETLTTLTENSDSNMAASAAWVSEDRKYAVMAIRTHSTSKTYVLLRCNIETMVGSHFQCQTGLNFTSEYKPRFYSSGGNDVTAVYFPYVNMYYRIHAFKYENATDTTPVSSTTETCSLAGFNMDSQFFKGTALDDSMILTYAVIDGSTSKLYRCQLNYSTTESMTLVAANLADTYSVDTFVDINTEKLSYAYVSSSNTSFPIQFGGEEYSSQINIEESTSPPSYPFGLSRLRMTKLENGQYCIGFAKMTATTSIIHTLKVLEGTTILNETSNVTVNAANSQPLISSTLVSNQNSCAYITWRNYATSYGMAAVGYEEIAAGVPAWFSGSLTDEISDLKATFDPGGNLRVVYAKDGGFEEMKYLKISKTLDAAYAATSVSLNTLNFSTTSGFLAGTQFIGGSGRLIMVESKSTGSTPANALNFYTLE